MRSTTLKLTIRSIPSILALTFALLGACASIPPNTQAPMRPIVVGGGPEDMVLDHTGPDPRLLISCEERRAERPAFAGIVAYGLSDGHLDTLERRGEPAGMVFRPHGIDLQVLEGIPNLYVITHDDAHGRQLIARYTVFASHLQWIMNYESPLFTSPNALSIRPDGAFYVSNDRQNRNSMMEAILGSKKAKLIYCTESGTCNVAADRICFGNGILNTDTEVIQAQTRGNAVFRYRIIGNKLRDRRKLYKLVGPDNLRRSENGILVACHIRGMKFMRHARSAEKRSPTVVYELKPGQKPEVIFANDGSLISAGATAIRFGGKLYVNQVFEPFILEIDLDKKK